MQQLMKCSECGLKYGVYSTFHHFPDDVERERRRHNCRLIQLCRRWEKLVRGPFYWDPRGRGQCDGDPPDASMQAAMIDVEDRAAVARALFEARTAAYTRAEARACSWTFAAAQADRALRLAATAGPMVVGLPAAGRDGRRRAEIAAHAGGKVAAVHAGAKTRAAATARAAVAERAARWARADVAAKADALNRAMDAVENSAREAGVLLPPRCPVRDDGDGGGRIVFEDVGESDSGHSDVEDDSDEYVTNLLNGENVDEDDDDDDDDDSGGDYDDDGVLIDL